MPIPIDIVFAGLIAFVATDSFEPSTAIAYLLDEPHHDPVVTFTGKVSLGSSKGSAIACTSSDVGEGHVIECPLGKTDITFDPPIAEGRLFPSRPPHNGVPTVGEDRRIGWLLRMSNIDGAGSGKVKPNVESLVGAKLTFGWSFAESYELDGQEPEAGRRGRPALIGFKTLGGRPALHRQAVAEAVRFESRIPEGRLMIKLFDRVSKSEQIVIADCEEAPCLTINIANNPREHTTCQDSTVVEGAHFVHYYDLVMDPPRDLQSRLIPYSISEKCSRQTKNKFSPGLVMLGLTSLRPIAPDLAEAIQKKVGPGRVSVNKLRAKTEKLLQKPRFHSLAKDKAKILDLLIDVGTDVQDRVICPPTVLEK